MGGHGGEGHFYAGQYILMTHAVKGGALPAEDDAYALICQSFKYLNIAIFRPVIGRPVNLCICDIY